MSTIDDLDDPQPGGWRTYAKAIAGAVVAALTAAVTAVTDGSISAVDGLIIAIAFVVALGAVWTVPNKGIAARESAAGDIVAGPDAPHHIPENTPVEVTPDQNPGA